MGYDPEEMEEYAGQSDELACNTESYERTPQALITIKRTDDAMRKVLYIEAYVKVDTEGTGIALLEENLHCRDCLQHRHE